MKTIVIPAQYIGNIVTSVSRCLTKGNHVIKNITKLYQLETPRLNDITFIIKNIY